MSMKFLKSAASFWKKVSGNVVLKDSSANVGIGTASPASKLDVQSGNITAVLGADSGAETLTDNTLKASRVGVPHYDTAEEPNAMLLGFSTSLTVAGLDIGGGTSLLNAMSQIRFYTAANSVTVTGTERMKIDTAGDVTVSTGNLVIGTAGKGIDFQNQASPAAGMTAELLDRYEEGTWTPQVYYQNATDQAAASNTTQTGYYTRIGRMVTAQFQLTFDASGTTPANDNIGIKNLPFTGASLTGTTQIAVAGLKNTDITTGDLYLWATYTTVSILSTSDLVGNLGNEVGNGSNNIFSGVLTYIAA